MAPDLQFYVVLMGTDGGVLCIAVFAAVGGEKLVVGTFIELAAIYEFRNFLVVNKQREIVPKEDGEFVEECFALGYDGFAVLDKLFVPQVEQSVVNGSAFGKALQQAVALFYGMGIVE